MRKKIMGMTRKVARPTGSLARRWGGLLSLVIVVGAALVFVRIVQAVHDTGAFELEGNAIHQTTDDWADIYAGTSSATAASFNSDDLLGNGPSLQATIFTGGGSKDPQDINQWAWKDGAGGLPDKDNLLHSFAARYSLPPTDPNNLPAPGSPVCFNGTGGPGQPTFDATKPCEVLFFGSDRFDNSGDAQQGFWFFQNEITLDTTPLGGGQAFNGVHETGDLLIISDFSNGGTTSTITIFRWDPLCTATNKPDSTCADANLRKLASSTAANCATATSGDAFCGIVNPGPGLTASPWPFLDKSGNTSFLNGEFYEGGVNLSLLGLAGECFASVASETRSSTSTTATLKDFVLGGFARCETGLVTTPKNGTGGAIAASGLSIGTGSVSVKDSATLTISGVGVWTGTLSFFLCGPDDLVSQSTCAIGGTQIGTGITVTNVTSQPILSDAATVTKAGNYCWRGTFTSGTSGVPDATDASAGECFVVTPVTPGIPTVASGAVVLGNAVYDQANLSGTANKPGSPVINPTVAGLPAGGTIIFKLYGPDDATCTTLAAGFPSAGMSVNVSGDNMYTSANFTPTVAGTYRWVASYSGDSPNTNSNAGVCGASNESVVVSPVQPAISTQATAGPVNLGTAISDSATLSGLAAPSNGVQGTITFRAFGPFSNLTTCTGSAVYTSVVTITGNGTYGSASGTGGNFIPTAAGTYNWIASYTPGAGDVNNLPVSGACGDANEGSVVQQLQPAISTAQTFTIQDSATITVASGAGNLAGTVRFRLYNNATCDTTNPNQLLYDSNTMHPAGIVVSGALTQTVNSDIFSITISKPVLSWLVEYTSTNAGHKNVASVCNTENASLLISNGGGGI